jgi:hypothetical protein
MKIKELCQGGELNIDPPAAERLKICGTDTTDVIRFLAMTVRQ